MTWLKIVSILQLLLMLPVVLSFLVMPRDFRAVGLFILVACIGAVTVPLGIWQFYRHRERRIWAGVLCTTPLLCLFVPLVLDALALGPLHPIHALLLGGGAVLSALIWIIARPSFWTSSSGLSSKRVLWLHSASLLLAFVLLALPVLIAASHGLPQMLSRRTSSTYAAWLLPYCLILTPTTAVFGILSMLVSLVGSWRYPPARFRHIVHAVAALFLLAVTSALGLAVGLLFVNPG